MLRSIISIMVGYIVVGFLTATTFAAVAYALLGGMPKQGQQPVTPSIPLQMALLAATALFAVAGGYAAALVARRAEVQHGLGLGALLLVLSASMFLPGHTEPLWFKLVTIAMTVPMPVLGGWLRKRFRAP